MFEQQQQRQLDDDEGSEEFNSLLEWKIHEKNSIFIYQLHIFAIIHVSMHWICYKFK